MSTDESERFRDCSLHRREVNEALWSTKGWRSKGKVTTHSRDEQKRADDLVNSNFNAHRPNQLWVVDLTYSRQ